MFYFILQLLQLALRSLFPLELSGSRRFDRVEPPRTHEKLLYGPCSLWFEELICLPKSKHSRKHHKILEISTGMFNNSDSKPIMIIIKFSSSLQFLILPNEEYTLFCRHDYYCCYWLFLMHILHYTSGYSWEGVCDGHIFERNVQTLENTTKPPLWEAT